MGAINYKTSEYITLAYNTNREYIPDDFWEDEEEQRQFEINFLYEQVKKIRSNYHFLYFHVEIDPGYYEGFSIQIERNFSLCFGCYEDKKEAQKEVTQLKKMLLECIEEGLVQCFPGWCTGYSTPEETRAAIPDIVKQMRDDIRTTPTERTWPD